MLGMGPSPSRSPSAEQQASWQQSYGANAEPVVHRGFENPVFAHNCFLNVILQGLWHLAAFRAALRDAPQHQHAHDAPCMTCSLRSIFAFYEHSDDAMISPDQVRTALADLHAAQKLFRIGDMADAAETIDAIFNALHLESLEQNGTKVPPGGEAIDVTCEPACPAHATFSTSYFSWWRCGACGVSSDPVPGCALTYPVYVAEASAAVKELLHEAFGVPAHARGGAAGGAGPAPQQHQHQLHRNEGVGTVSPTAAVHAGGIHCSLGAVLSRLAAKDALQTLSADAMVAKLHGDSQGGVRASCARQAPLPERYALSLPRVFVASLVWPSNECSKEEVGSMMDLVGQLLDLRQLFRLEMEGMDGFLQGEPQAAAGGPKGNVYRLRAIVCYYGLHYVVIVASERNKAWLLFDDKRISVVGNYAAVIRKCIDGRYQPTLLFYEQMQHANGSSGCGGGGGSAVEGGSASSRASADGMRHPAPFSDASSSATTDGHPSSAHAAPNGTVPVLLSLREAPPPPPAADGSSHPPPRLPDNRRPSGLHGGSTHGGSTAADYYDNASSSERRLEDAPSSSLAIRRASSFAPLTVTTDVSNIVVGAGNGGGPPTSSGATASVRHSVDAEQPAPPSSNGRVGSNDHRAAGGSWASPPSPNLLRITSPDMLQFSGLAPTQGLAQLAVNDRVDGASRVGSSSSSAPRVLLRPRSSSFVHHVPSVMLAAGLAGSNAAACVAPVRPCEDSAVVAYLRSNWNLIRMMEIELFLPVAAAVQILEGYKGSTVGALARQLFGLCLEDARGGAPRGIVVQGPTLQPCPSLYDEMRIAPFRGELDARASLQRGDRLLNLNKFDVNELGQLDEILAGLLRNEHASAAGRFPPLTVAAPTSARFCFAFECAQPV